jgi:uncharacterized integral membrane protein (TIGR00697 family)
MKQKTLTFRRLDAVIALYIFLTITAELLGAKTFPILHAGAFALNASVAIFALPFIFSLNDVVLEVYSKKRARNLALLGMGTVVLLILYTALATSLPPSARFTPTESAYDTIFQFSIRISLASIAAFACSQLLDIAIFAKLRERMQNRALWLRNNLSNFLGFFVDYAVFLTLAFYAFDKGAGDNIGFIMSLLIPYWLLKCAVSVLGTPLVYAGVKWLRKDPDTTA